MNPRSSNPTSEGDSRRFASMFFRGRIIAWDGSEPASEVGID